MVISSGLPYTYHPSSWAGSETGKFRIGSQIVQPSAIHFEESMFALKSEYNRVVNKQSGYVAQGAAPHFFFNTQGRFQRFLNNRSSGNFDPNPTGDYLGGKLALTNFAINTDNEAGIRRPGAIHQSGYIESMRALFDYIFTQYGAKGGSWATGAVAADRASGAKRDWLTVYKGYTDNYANSGMWYHNDTSVAGGDKTFLVSGLFDRYLDEVRPQPIPYFGLDNGISMTFLDHEAPWGNQVKMDKHDYPVLRPRYMFKDCGLPSGWASGLEIGRNNTVSPGTGIGGYLVTNYNSADGLCITISGGGNGLSNNIYVVTGVATTSGMGTESRPESPSWCALTSLGASGSTQMVSGQYRVFLTNNDSGQRPAFPWGTGVTTHKSAQWPLEGEYEPMNGRMATSVGDYFHTDTRSQSFWVTDHVFVVQGDHGGTSAAPRLQSGIYWLQLNQGPSHTIQLLDAWTQESAGTGGVVAGNFYQSGYQTLWGLSKGNDTKSQYNDGTVPLQVVVGAGWEYDRANNYYVKTGYSGLSTTSIQTSGVYARYNQQMKFIDTSSYPRVTIGSVSWQPTRPWFLSRDGTKTWLMSGTCASGSTSDPLAADTTTDGPWFRLNSSFQIQDGLLAKTDTFKGIYLANTSEYIGLWRGAGNAMNAGEMNGEQPANYYLISSITWGDLQNPDAAGSGSYTKTKYGMTFNSDCWAYLNLEASGKLHIGTFFETEPDNQVYCTLLSFASGAASGAGNTPDWWIGKVTVTSHPYNCTDVWRLGSAGTFYSNILAGNGMRITDIDIGSMAHMEIHVNG
jgi:hypothetical protein